MGAQWNAKVTRDPLKVWICIPETPTSLNAWSRKHWSARHRAVQEMTDNLRILALAHGLPTIAKAEVRIAYYFTTSRRRDPDNYAGKFILDGLRKAGIIRDDNAGLIRLPQPEFRIDEAAPHTEIFISEWQ